MGRKNRMKKLLLVLFIFLPLFGLLFQSVSLAQVQNDNKVDAFLVIPSDWIGQITPEIEARYKQNILSGLTDVQQFYAKNLQGHTFVLDNNVQVLRSNGVIKKTETWCGVFDLTEDLSLPITPSNRARVFFVVGSKNYANCGLLPNAKSKYGGVIFRENPGGEVYINYQDLEGLGDSGQRPFTLRDLAHELGHAFGLDFTGWARTHSCSVVDKNECRGDIPEIVNKQYPPESEANSIMSPDGGASRIGGGLSYGFNSSIYNPEVQKLFDNPFINPNKNTAPIPTSQAIVQSAKVISISPNPANSGETLHMVGNNFGEKAVNVPLVIYNGKISPWPIDLEVISWKDSEIIAKIPQITSEYAADWIIYIYKKSGEKVDVIQQLTIKPSVSTVIVSTPAPVPTYIPSPTPNPKLTATSPISSSTPSPTPAPTSTPTPVATITGPNVPAGKIPYSDPWDSGCRNLGGTKCYLNSLFQSLCTEDGGISLGQGTAGGCYDQGTTCCKYVTSCQSLTGQCVTAFDKTNVQFQNEPTHTRVFGYCPTDFYDYQKSGDESQLCWNRPGVTPQSPSTVSSSSPPTTTPSPFPTPTSVTTQIRVANYKDFQNNLPGDGGSTTATFTTQSQNPIIWTKSTINPNSPIYVTTINSDGTNGVISSVSLANGQLYQVPNSPFVIQAKIVRKIVKITVTNGQNINEITSNFTQAINLPLHGTEGVNGSYPVIFTIDYNDGSSKSFPFTFNYQPNPTVSQPSSSCPIPNTPPFPGGSYTGQSADCSVVMWYDPSLGKTRTFKNGIELNPPSATPVSTPTSTPAPVASFSKTGTCYQSGYNSNICGTTVPGAGGQCDYLGQQSTIPCTITCPDGTPKTGTSVSTCGVDGCYTNSCSCNANCISP